MQTVYAPPKTLHSRRSKAVRGLLKAFQSIERNYQKGSTAVEAVRYSKRRIADALQPLIAQAEIQGYQASGARVTPGFRRKADTRAASSSLRAAKLIRRTTRRRLKSAKTEYTFSEKRAEIIAEYEMRRAYFDGVIAGLAKLKTPLEKQWSVDPRHPEDDICDDNEDQGPIAFDAVFESGHFGPPAHPNCMCRLIVQVSKVKANADYFEVYLGPTPIPTHMDTNDEDEDLLDDPEYEDRLWTALEMARRQGGRNPGAYVAALPPVPIL